MASLAVAGVISCAGSPVPLLAQIASGTFLRPGERLERRLTGSAPDVLHFQVTAGQFFRIEVLQSGSDLAVVLRGPRSELIAQSDFDNGGDGPETIAAIAEISGDYTIEVTRPGRSGSDAFVVKVLDFRDSRPGDPEIVAAYRYYSEGVGLMVTRTSAGLTRAKAQFELALSSFSRLGDRYMEGLSAKDLGVVSMQAGDYKAALPWYDKAAAAFRTIPDPRDEAEAWNAAGGVYSVLGEPDEALKLYQQAAALDRAGGFRLHEGLTLNNSAVTEFQLSHWQQALDGYRQALPLFRVAGERGRESLVLQNMGVAYGQLGDPAEEERLYTQALLIRRELGDRPGIAATLTAMAALLLREGNSQAALEHADEALVLRRQLADRRGVAEALAAQGRAFAALKRFTDARQALAESLRIAREVGDRTAVAFDLFHLAAAGVLAGDSNAAADYARQAALESRALGNHRLEALALEALARTEDNRGNAGEARQRIEAAISVSEKDRLTVDSQQLRASFSATHQDAYTFYIDLLMRSGSADALALETSERSRARSLLEMMAASGTAIREGVDAGLLERERSISDRLNAKGSRLLALNAADKRAAEFRQEIRDLEAEYQDVQAAIRKSSPRYAAVSQPGVLTVPQIQQNLLDADTLLLEYSLGDERSYLWVVGKDGLRSFVLAARAKIEAKALAVAQLMATRAPARTLDVAAAELGRMVLGDAGPALGNKRLLIVPDGALQSIPFAMLTEPGTRDPLLVRHEVVIAPSASALAALRTQVTGRTPPPKSLAVFADPVFDGSDPRAGAVTMAAVRPDTSRVLEHLAGEKNSAATALHIPRLPYTAQEADRILRIAPHSSNLKAIGFDASRAMAIGGRLSEFKYLHFATHGYLDTERPELSALVLSQIDSHNQPEDGFLRVDDIYNAKLSADLVVLSACQTGLGKEVRGEGVMGLTRAFLYAGVPEVIVSLWNVNDRATAELMATFYEKLLRHGKRPSAALREAQLELRKQKRWESPYYWAAFVQQGDWR